MDFWLKEWTLEEAVTTIARCNSSQQVTVELRHHITQDAGPNNGIERWRGFQELVDDKTLQTRITMMAGAGTLLTLSHQVFLLVPETKNCGSATLN
ncbi:MAG: hypothetical protein CM1200mP22_13570 [Dehalococcoidia bacterium]|nr:MAG: hypothetical protein CM1200mP22_13570 [Dehalococcoidia bacterium]